MLGLNLNFVFVSMQTKGDHGCLLAMQGGFFLVLFFGAALSSQSTTPSDSQQPPTTCTHFSRQLKVTRGSPADL